MFTNYKSCLINIRCDFHLIYLVLLHLCMQKHQTFYFLQVFAIRTLNETSVNERPAFKACCLRTHSSSGWGILSVPASCNSSQEAFGSKCNWISIHTFGGGLFHSVISSQAGVNEISPAWPQKCLTWLSLLGRRPTFLPRAVSFTWDGLCSLTSSQQ